MNQPTLTMGAAARLLGLIAVLLAPIAPEVHAGTVPGNWKAANGITVQKGSQLYDTAKRVYYTVAKLTNRSGAAMSGPVRLLVTASSYTVVNGSGSDARKPFFTVLPDAGSLADGDTRSVRIDFQPTRGTLTYSIEAQDRERLLDSDNDGIADATDTCPLDPQNDADHDGLCSDVDLCPNDPTNRCITITGQVYGGGAALANASITVGTTNPVTTAPDEFGRFTATGIGNDQIANDRLQGFFPVSVSAPGFSGGFAKVTTTQGKTDYEVTIGMKSISTIITQADDLASGLRINQNGATVGALTVPPAALPSGVTALSGTATYLDPATSDIYSAPGGDLLALPAGADPNAKPLTFVPYGIMEFDLKDQDGTPVHTLAGPAEVCIKARAGLNPDDSAQLWWFDPAVGLWKGDGQGTVVERDGQSMVCGNVTHFTHWAYGIGTAIPAHVWSEDDPVDTHACFKFRILTDAGAPRVMLWAAHYQGLGRVAQRPLPQHEFPCLDWWQCNLDSFTVPRSYSLSPKGFTVYTTSLFGVNGYGASAYYLVRDSDSVYRLTDDEDQATVFWAPEDVGSAVRDYQVENCRFLDYKDSVPDGILMVSTYIDYPPRISGFAASQSMLAPGASTPLQVKVTDPAGLSPVSVTWTHQCFDQAGELDDSGSINPVTDSGSSGNVFQATFTAPTNPSLPYESCSISVTATRANGKAATANLFVPVNASSNYVVTGTLYAHWGEPWASNTTLLP